MIRTKVGSGWCLAPVVVGCLLLAGCCSEDSAVVQQNARADAPVASVAETGVSEIVAVPDPEESRGTGQHQPMTFKIAAREGMKVSVDLVSTACVEGVATDGSIKVMWESTLPGTTGIRVSIDDGVTQKVWAEGGAVGSETTGAWVKDGMVFQFEDMVSQVRLGEIHITARACGAAR